MEFIREYADWFYLIGAVLFILTLRGLSGPKTAIAGNRYGMIAMAIAVLTTFFVADNPVVWMIVGAMVLGAIVGIARARTVPMTQMPETVALMHSLVGLAAVLIAIAAIIHNNKLVELGPDLLAANGINFHEMSKVHLFELFVGCFVGAITFTASVFAYGKLAAKKWAKTISGAWVKPVQALIFIAMLGFGIHFFLTGNMTSFWAMTGLALAFGWVWIAPVGGGDMPVVVSLLNSFSGWAAAGIGFTLENNMLIVAGSLVGSSGAILSYIMCKAMNRSIINVLFGGAMGGAAAPTAGAGEQVQRNYRSGSADDAGFLMSNADSVVIVPGYGMAQGRAQNAVKELANLLKEQGVTVRFAIHPVAGRMPGHMNVLLAEADVPYEDILEMDEINSDFPATDVVLVIGANDVVNPAAKDDPNSPIYGMPILEAHKARTIMVIKRSMATGYAGLDNDLFYNDKTMMIFGDAKKVVEDMTKSINGTGH
ncbi:MULTISPECIES: NAD(P)(+) transhydrogenase (Re/Si-specific) subunit beta [Acinetobacter]|jgi:NAD(P) transhydrogenase subunit beta|uniref:NAD(P)(+) transhydrogenase (Re/Si-specific) subunit beta n=1 Tax=Acinetobacter TaxID=469 RepID=UPI00144460F3|nr:MULTISPECIES: NAD(P)(+) transhydrogenase (Re/Si-specific) subunit beta [Acinetobacter]MDM1486926.1 NAD(P)(+) transhydrogenase (Re/Si-specific) subunit beta [Acinetobacter towneri]MEB6565980.1 NAD(P)(+) transhydrogenase (Re/Si-specific) subunit beta [Acinetobacter towneri]NLN57050.1 NAD(P)(+) transhydrogenase (Re/Si-specific) subunit beta [Gammaproteobacteria bacterium]